MSDKIKVDTALKDYWRDNDRLADLFNQKFFGGKKIIHPKDLYEQDTDLSSVLSSNQWNRSIEKHRDIVKLHKNGTVLVLIALENQQEVHYAMPLRNALYDILSYHKQCDEIAKIHKKDKDLRSGSEYLSGMKKEDKLNFVLTLVICYSKEEWDGARKLSDMVHVPEEFRDYFNDYSINLLQISEASELGFQMKDNVDLFEGIKLYYKKEHMTKEAYRNSFKGKQYSKDVLLTIGAVIKSEVFVRYAIESEERSIEMTAVLDKYDEELIKEGRKEGIEQVVRNMLRQKVSIEDISIFTGLSIEQIRSLQR